MVRFIVMVPQGAVAVQQPVRVRRDIRERVLVRITVHVINLVLKDVRGMT